MIIVEKLEDIPDGIKKKWYDVFNMQLRKALKGEFERIFNKFFKVNHPMIDNKRTKIRVSLPLIGYVYFIDINLFDKKGSYIIDTEHPENTMGDPLEVQYMKKNNKWEPYYHTLFLLPQYQNKGIGKKVVQSLNKCTKELQNTKEVFYQGVAVGKYMISRIKGAKFKTKTGLWSEAHVVKNYKKWCDQTGTPFKKLSKPSDYPKEYLLSNVSPMYIDYLVPI